LAVWWRKEILECDPGATVGDIRAHINPKASPRTHDVGAPAPRRRQAVDAASRDIETRQRRAKWVRSTSTATASKKFAAKLNQQALHSRREGGAEATVGGLSPPSRAGSGSVYIERVGGRRTSVSAREALRRRGGRSRDLGRSPGFRELRWIKR